MIILASASPRRRERLARICRGFTVEVSDVEEITRYRKPHLAVQEIACRKCCAVADRHPRDIVIAADTVVCLGGRIMGKPTDPDDAKRMLKELSGREHTVYTGVCVKGPHARAVYYEKSSVRMNELSDEFIDDYVASGAPLDKAGAYGIQDKGVVAGYTGEYANVMGLPLARLETILRSAE